MIELTREEIEQRLEKKYLGAVVSIELPLKNRALWSKQQKAFPDHMYTVAGKIQRIGVETIDDEPMVVFSVNRRLWKADVNYFIENIKVHGNTHTGGTGGRRVPEAD